MHEDGSTPAENHPQQSLQEHAPVVHKSIHCKAHCDLQQGSGVRHIGRESKVRSFVKHDGEELGRHGISTQGHPLGEIHLVRRKGRPECYTVTSTKAVEWKDVSLKCQGEKDERMRLQVAEGQMGEEAG